MAKESSDGPGGSGDTWSLLHLFPEGQPTPDTEDDDQLTVQQKVALIQVYRNELESRKVNARIRDILHDEIDRLTYEIGMFNKTQETSEQNHG